MSDWVIERKALGAKDKHHTPEAVSLNRCTATVWIYTSFYIFHISSQSVVRAAVSCSALFCCLIDRSCCFESRSSGLWRSVVLCSFCCYALKMLTLMFHLSVTFSIHYSFKKCCLYEYCKKITYSVQIGSGAHPASYQMGTRGSFPGGKAAGAWSCPLTSI